ncbi:VOC family protein [Deinococcus sp. QL22]|uniref:VOC family protein n=1 Tax=Deinococcus sp. QL22 TaxID=2939437 RepID=UPI00201816FE|nr:VOC family protein [Deinococcus sp. QL22]UQN08494.1 VOC family protein [Deinococcus sp. QL22]
MTKDTTWTNTITLFAENLKETKAFYSRVFELPIFFEGDTSVVFTFGSTRINLLQIGQANELVTPANVANSQTGARAVYTLEVDDVDTKCAELETKGVPLLNGPMDRPWGIRTASFKDPAGNIWEIAR